MQTAPLVTPVLLLHQTVPDQLATPASTPATPQVPAAPSSEDSGAILSSSLIVPEAAPADRPPSPSSLLLQPPSFSDVAADDANGPTSPALLEGPELAPTAPTDIDGYFYNGLDHNDDRSDDNDDSLANMVPEGYLEPPLDPDRQDMTGEVYAGADYVADGYDRGVDPAPEAFGGVGVSTEKAEEEQGPSEAEEWAADTVPVSEDQTFSVEDAPEEVWQPSAFTEQPGPESELADPPAPGPLVPQAESDSAAAAYAPDAEYFHPSHDQDGAENPSSIAVDSETDVAQYLGDDGTAEPVQAEPNDAAFPEGEDNGTNGDHFEPRPSADAGPVPPCVLSFQGLEYWLFSPSTATEGEAHASRETVFGAAEDEPAALFRGSLAVLAAELKLAFGVANDVALEFPDLELVFAEVSLDQADTWMGDASESTLDSETPFDANGEESSSGDDSGDAASAPFYQAEDRAEFGETPAEYDEDTPDAEPQVLGKRKEMPPEVELLDVEENDGGGKRVRFDESDVMTKAEQGTDAEMMHWAERDDARVEPPLDASNDAGDARPSGVSGHTYDGVDGDAAAAAILDVSEGDAADGDEVVEIEGLGHFDGDGGDGGAETIGGDAATVAAGAAEGWSHLEQEERKEPAGEPEADSQWLQGEEERVEMDEEVVVGAEEEAGYGQVEEPDEVWQQGSADDVAEEGAVEQPQ
ncbi:hypothetical protein HK405_009875, partial [Cladochytrium tenue]